MSEQKRRSDFTMNLFCYCRSCAAQYCLPAGEGNRLPDTARCELCGQIAVPYITDRTLSALLFGVDVDAIIAERALNN